MINNKIDTLYLFHWGCCHFNLFMNWDDDLIDVFLGDDSYNFNNIFSKIEIGIFIFLNNNL